MHSTRAVAIVTFSRDNVCIKNLFMILLKDLGRFELGMTMMLHACEACDSLKKMNADFSIRSLRIKLCVT